MIKQLLHASWTVRAVGDLCEVPSSLHGVTVPARVPGCVHTDLLRAGKIEDPYKDRNEFAVRWIGRTDWEYRTTFEADPKLFDHERIDLVCDGLDTVAVIVLNGTEVARTQNMHRGYRFDVRNLLKRGTNELIITFASPVKYAEAMQHKLGRRPYVNGPAGPFNFIRKMACNFGWDWGPALPTSGIWRGVRLEGWNCARIARMIPNATPLPNGRVQLRIEVQLETASRAHAWNWSSDSALFTPEGERVPLKSITAGGSPKPEVCVFEIDDPKLWWPGGHGGQPLYRFEHVLAGEMGTSADDRQSARIGLRTVELDTSPDEIGAKFVLKVNGKPIFCKGFNWIPDDCFLDRARDPTRVRQRIQQALDAGANMLRVWGGGIYETDEFYDICDELGILVWQDFPFACAMYPEEEPFKSEIEAEARDNVARLAHHPSLALWNGCNENLWGYRDWGWKDSDEVRGKTWGLGYYLDLLPKIVKELDPSRPYWAASPWSGDPDPDNGIHPNADTHGNMHVWRPWFHEDYATYRQFSPRFCSEFGFQGPATYASIASIVPPEGRDFGSPQMRHRQKCGDTIRDDGDRRNLRHLLRHFNLPGAAELLDALASPNPDKPVPYCGAEPVHPASVLPSRVNFDDLHYLLQLNQARALTLGVEWFRSRQPRCMGTLYWQLNDCWPGVTSWSCIDGDGRKKPLWYATRRFFREMLWTFQPEADGSLWLYFINDTDTAFGGLVTTVRSDFTGNRLAEQQTIIAAAPRAVGEVRVEPHVATPRDPSGELLWTTADPAARWFFAVDRELSYPPPQFDAEWSDRVLRIEAKSLLRDLCVYIDRLDPDASISDQLITLMPGESHAFRIDSSHSLSVEQLTTWPVLQCANRFGITRL